MPAQDNTGPQGIGPLTGRGLGNCQGLRMGFRMNRRQGLGRCMSQFFNWPSTQQTSVDEKTELDEYEKALKTELQEVVKAKKTLPAK